MKVLITADVHYGIPGKTHHSNWAMKVIREYAAKKSIDVILVLGDLFHDRNSISVDALATVHDFFDVAVNKYNQRWVVLPGNHDLYLKNSWDVTSLKHLSNMIDIIGDVKLLNIGGRSFWVLPFIHYESVYMDVVKSINNKASTDDILLTHIGINGAKLNECFLMKNWSIVNFDDTKFASVFTGHFHCHQNVGKAWYPGSPIPFRFDEGLVDHGFIEYDVDSNTFEFVKIFDNKHLITDECAPDYLTITESQIESDFTNSHVRVCLDSDYTSNGLSELRSKLIGRGALSVKWMKAKQDKNVDKINVDVTKKDVFAKWLEYDKPKIDHDIIKQHNEMIINKASEIIANRDEEDA